MELPEKVGDFFSLKRSILNVCLGSECASEYYPCCDSRMCSSSYDSTNEIATNKRLFTMIISSRGFTKHGHCLHKHILSSNISLNNVKEVAKV